MSQCDIREQHPEAIQHAVQQMPIPEDIVETCALLKAIAEPTRLKLLLALRAGELCVCDLAVASGMSESAVSHQLRVLRHAKLVQFRKSSRMAYYSLQDHHVLDIISCALAHIQEGAS